MRYNCLTWSVESGCRPDAFRGRGRPEEVRPHRPAVRHSDHGDGLGVRGGKRGRGHRAGFPAPGLYRIRTKALRLNHVPRRIPLIWAAHALLDSDLASANSRGCAREGARTCLPGGRATLTGLAGWGAVGTGTGLHLWARPAPRLAGTGRSTAVGAVRHLPRAWQSTTARRSALAPRGRRQLLSVAVCNPGSPQRNPHRSTGVEPMPPAAPSTSPTGPADARVPAWQRGPLAAHRPPGDPLPP